MERMILNRIFGAALVCASAVLVSSCGSTFMVAADDMYGTMPSRSEERALRYQASTASAAQSSAQPASSDNSSYSYSYSEPLTSENTYQAEPDTFNYDDYYDYEYSSRLRRFHNDDYVSNDYYSDYYTNTYWYDRDPYYYGTSIYLGYNWWYPSYYCYRPSWYWDWRWGWNYGWGYGWNYGWNYGWGCGSYAWGYGNGYWNGYWDGYYDRYWREPLHDYCYNPYDRNTYTHCSYGHRLSGNSPVRQGTSGRTSGADRGDVDGSGTLPAIPSDGFDGHRVYRAGFAERYEAAVGTSVGNGRISGTANGLGTVKQDSDPRSSASQPRVQPSTMMESVSKRLAIKDVKVTPGSATNNQPAATPARTVNQNETARTQPQQAPVRTQHGEAARTYQSATPTRTQTQAQPQQRQPQRPQPQQQQSAQPRPYNTPVYNTTRGTQSYTSPQYNRPAENGNGSRTTAGSAPSRPASTSAPAQSSRTSAPARTTQSRPAATGTPSRPGGSSSGSRPAGSSSHSSYSGGSRPSGSSSHSSGGSSSAPRR